MVKNICTKRIFRSRADARKKRKEIMKSNTYIKGKKLRIYSCPNCGKFHLTSEKLTRNRRVQYERSRKKSPQHGVNDRYTSKQNDSSSREESTIDAY